MVAKLNGAVFNSLIVVWFYDIKDDLDQNICGVVGNYNDLVMVMILLSFVT